MNHKISTSIKTSFLLVMIILLGKALLPGATTFGIYGNPTITPIGGGTVTTNSGGFGQVNPNQFSTNNDTLTIVENVPLTNPAVAGTVVFRTASAPTVSNRVAGTFSVTATQAVNTVAISTLYTNFVPANLLTNDGDTIELDLLLMNRIGVASSNTFNLIYGSQTILSVGAASLLSNTVYKISASITRSGNTAQICNGIFNSGGEPLGMTYGWTNAVSVTAQTNGIDTRLYMTVTTANSLNSMTNLMGRLRFYPAP